MSNAATGVDARRTDRLTMRKFGSLKWFAGIGVFHAVFSRAMPQISPPSPGRVVDLLPREAGWAFASIHGAACRASIMERNTADPHESHAVTAC